MVELFDNAIPSPVVVAPYPAVNPVLKLVADVPNFTFTAYTYPFIIAWPPG